MEVAWDNRSHFHIAQRITDNVRYSIVLQPVAWKRILDWQFTIFRMACQEKAGELELDSHQSIRVAGAYIQFIDTKQRRCILCSPLEWIELVHILKHEGPNAEHQETKHSE